MIAAYGLANLLQSIAATRTKSTATLDPGLLLRLFGSSTYLLGLGCQILGFFLALATRRDLPLFLVQSAVTGGLCVTALLGVIFLKWKLPRAEIALLLLVVLGIGALAASAEPSHSEQLGIKGIISLIVALAVIVGCSVFAVRIKGVLGSVVLGSIAGLNFASAAIAARPLAGAHTVAEFVLNPLLYLVIAHSLTGQLLLGLAMQRGSTNAAVAGMDAAGAVPAAVLGLVLLGDQMRPGLEWLAVLGFVVTLGAVIALTRYAEPQHELASEPVPIPQRYLSAVVPGLPPHPARGVAECETATSSSAARTHPTIVLQRPLARPQHANGHAAAGANGHTVNGNGQSNGQGSEMAKGIAANGHEPGVSGQAVAMNGQALANGNGHSGKAVEPETVSSAAQASGI